MVSNDVVTSDTSSPQPSSQNSRASLRPFSHTQVQMGSPFECPVCLETFNHTSKRQPLALPCGHSFCRSCLDLVQPLRCPTVSLPASHILIAHHIRCSSSSAASELGGDCNATQCVHNATGVSECFRTSSPVVRNATRNSKMKDTAAHECS